MPTQRADSGPEAADPVSKFFADLACAGHVTTFEGQSATVRFEVADRDKVRRWHLTVNNGDVAVTRQDRPADAIVRASRPQAEAMVTGRLNAQAAFLRGALACEGKMAAVVMFQRCLPGPPGSTGRAAPISGQIVMAQIDAAQIKRAQIKRAQLKPAQRRSG
jgi:SCP-2 sterol transfer family